ncbi:tetratricopeptide repeat protein [Halobacillus sp. B23F22_1]|uniref:tetratricopeptide repeat protein n=1 Tax=Halobacillus sp. B23F22_1 TaxID=3459514 RepID=UPI00373E75E8
MEKHNGDIVLFPKWKSTLENTGFQAVKEKRYKDAVESFVPLVEHQVANHEVITGLLMSWIELGNFAEAEELCQEQMKNEENHYYEYLHIYITILFQSNRYRELIDLIDEVFETEDVPTQNRTQLWQMYEVTKKLLQDVHKKESDQLIDELKSSIEKGDLQKQWVAVNQLKKQPLPSDLTIFQEWLIDEKIHPIIKTGIVFWLRDEGFSEEMTIHKFGHQLKISPSNLNSFQSDYIIQQIKMRLGAIEQSNPTMFKMINDLLKHYCYVRYPLFPSEEEVDTIVEALKQLGHDYLQIPYDAQDNILQVDRYKEEIELCEQHYMILIGE